jgi:proteic killer suppression protein
VIKNFRRKGLAEFFETGSKRRVQAKHAKHAKRLRLILTMLNVASHAGQMDAPGLRLHPLKGKPAGRFAVDVDENFRVAFRFDGGHAVEVDYGDYH